MNNVFCASPVVPWSVSLFRMEDNQPNEASGREDVFFFRIVR